MAKELECTVETEDKPPTQQKVACPVPGCVVQPMLRSSLQLHFVERMHKDCELVDKRRARGAAPPSAAELEVSNNRSCDANYLFVYAVQNKFCSNMIKMWVGISVRTAVSKDIYMFIR